MKRPTYRVTDVALALVDPGPNDRTVFRQEDVETLAASIAAEGLAQPITVRPRPTGRFEIVAGERRSRAARHLGWTTIPAIVRELDDEQAAGIMLAENSHRVDLSPIDEARAYASRIARFGWTPAECARRAQVSGGRVTSRLLLLDLVEEAQQLIAVGQMGASFGEVMAPLDANRQRIALRWLVATERPRLVDWRAVCGKLLAEQAQESLFDVDALFGAAIAEVRAADAAARARFPVAPDLPAMRTVLGGVGANLETYIAQLLASDDAHLRDTVAPIVGHVYAQLIAGHLATPPKTSPLDAGEEKAA